MPYVLTNGAGAVERYPYPLEDLARDRPGFPAEPTDEQLAEVGIFPVELVEMPQPGFTRNVSALPPVEENGAWKERWLVNEISLDEAKAAMLSALAAIRYGRETGGIILQGTPFKTDRETQAILTGAFVMASADANFTITWKSAPGVHTPIDAQTILAVGAAVTAHVQTCFEHEADLAAAVIAAQDATELDAIDITKGWPE